MYIIVLILLGCFIGWIASLLTNNNKRMGIIANIVVGLIGSAIGGFIAQLLDIAPLNIFSFWGITFAILGAVLLLLFVDLITNKSRR